MATRTAITSPRWQDVINFLLGVWLFLSPWVLAYTAVTPAATSAWISGAAIAVLALLAIFVYQAWEEWISAAIGVWVFVSHWVLRASTGPSVLWNGLIVGALLVILALWSVSLEHGSGEVASSS